MPRDVPPDTELHDLIVAATLAPLHWLRAHTALEDGARDAAPALALAAPVVPPAADAPAAT